MADILLDHLKQLHLIFNHKDTSRHLQASATAQDVFNLALDIPQTEAGMLYLLDVFFITHCGKESYMVCKNSVALCKKFKYNIFYFSPKITKFFFIYCSILFISGVQ